MTTSEAQVLVHRDGPLTRVVLNRPRAINALTLDMVHLIEQAIHDAKGGESRAILIEGAGERGLCGGADIKALRAGGADAASAFIEAEYRLDLLTHTSPIPIIGLMDGITMGGGIGLTAHAAIRIVTERSRLAMPEVKIGIAPDVGGHRILANAPGRIGEYLAVTAGSMTSGDAIALGFADHFLPTERISALKERLAARLADETAESIVHGLAEPAPNSPLMSEGTALAGTFEDVLGRDEPVSVFMASEEGHAELAQWAVGASRYLIARLERSEDAREREVAASIRSSSPTSVAVTLAQIARTRTLDLSLEQVLDDDLRVVSRLFRRPDFAEGVRAVVIDKDRNAAWQPSSIEHLEASRIAEILAP